MQATQKHEDFPPGSVLWRLVIALLVLAAAPGQVAAEPAPEAIAAFNSYIGVVESRLVQQHRSQNGFLLGLRGQKTRCD